MIEILMHGFPVKKCPPEYQLTWINLETTVSHSIEEKEISRSVSFSFVFIIFLQSCNHCQLSCLSSIKTSAAFSSMPCLNHHNFFRFWTLRSSSFITRCGPLRGILWTKIVRLAPFFADKICFIFEISFNTYLVDLLVSIFEISFKFASEALVNHVVYISFWSSYLNGLKSD